MNIMRAQAGAAGDAGHPATFLASDEAGWITGAVLLVESGALSVTPLMMAPYPRAVPKPKA